jgi:hypothetical protein
LTFSPSLPNTLTEALRSHALTLGVFEAVNGHEPVGAPTVTGLTAAIWLQSIEPAPRGSGLSITSGVFTYNVRGYSRMVMEPLDAIDPNLTAAMGLLYAAYSGDFQLGGNAMAVDLLGQAGRTMRTEAGYINQDNSTLRVLTMNVPIILADLWTQAP